VDDDQSTIGKKKQDHLIGTKIVDRYEILSVIGYGGTTSVYKANDLGRGRFVVIKMLHTHSTASEITVRRFEQECSTLALLKHRNIVAHYDNGVTDEDQPFLVMEYLDGVTLKQLIEESGSLEVKEALSIFIQACAGLAAAHEKSIVHRDMKPANIMVLRDEQAVVQVKILDFGVAKLLIQGETFQTKTQTGEMLGTLLYMSPEQCLDQDLDGRSDVYSLGCVLYEALTGKPPICGRTAFETMNKHLSFSCAP
jgi:serine/threonine protein kinase